MKDYLKFVDANYWDKNVRFGVFVYNDNKNYIFKFFISEGAYQNYFVAGVRTLNMTKVYESKKLYNMKAENLIKFFGEEFYDKYKKGNLTIKYLQKVEKRKSEQIRKMLEISNNKNLYELLND